MIIKKLDYTYSVKEDKHLPFWNLLNGGIWEPALFDILKKYLNKESIYIDIGSWIGPTVLFASNLSDHCYAIEPDENAFDTMKENIMLNKTNISIDKLAIMDYDGEVKLGIACERGDSMSSVLLENNQDGYKVKCMKFSTFLKEKALSRVDFIKIDVEGAETIILPDIKELIRSLGYPYIHLSIHQAYFKNRTEDIEKVLDFCYMYNISKNQISSIKNSELFDIFLSSDRRVV